MTREVITAHPLDPIEDAASMMYESNVGCILVVRGEDFVGIITSSDVMRALMGLLGVQTSSPIEIEMPDWGLWPKL